MKKNPEAKIICLLSSLPNPSWSASHQEFLWSYLKKSPIILDKMIKKSSKYNQLIILDLTSVWKQLRKKKSYYSITGNGINHPNDFGHRIYAAAILKSLFYFK